MSPYMTASLATQLRTILLIVSSNSRHWIFVFRMYKLDKSYPAPNL